MASISVDLPEPMSPVNSPFWPCKWSVHTFPPNVPQLNTSRRSRRKPLSRSSPTKSSLDGSIIQLFLFAGQQDTVIRETPVEFGEPLSIDESFQEAPHLEHISLTLQ